MAGEDLFHILLQGLAQTSSVQQTSNSEGGQTLRSDLGAGSLYFPQYLWNELATQYLNGATPPPSVQTSRGAETTSRLYQRGRDSIEQITHGGNESNNVIPSDFLQTEQTNAVPPAYLQPEQNTVIPSAFLQTEQTNAVPPAYLQPEQNTVLPSAFLQTEQTNAVPPAYLQPEQNTVMPSAFLQTEQTNAVPPAYLQPEQNTVMPSAFLQTEQTNALPSAYLQPEQNTVMSQTYLQAEQNSVLRLYAQYLNNAAPPGNNQNRGRAKTTSQRDADTSGQYLTVNNSSDNNYPYKNSIKTGLGGSYKIEYLYKSGSTKFQGKKLKEKFKYIYDEDNKFCVFCRQNRETEDYVRSHNLKDIFGYVTCPILSAYTCPQCFATGVFAHTRRHCPFFVSHTSQIQLRGKVIRRNAAGQLVVSNV